MWFANYNSNDQNAFILHGTENNNNTVISYFNTVITIQYIMSHTQKLKLGKAVCLILWPLDRHCFPLSQ